jgi:spore coat polysaccharide biosynthesis protein SpsF (cytidylyltransferase family)
MNVAIIQARLSSSRLPGKIFLEVCGKSLLEHMITRVKRSKKIDELIIATSTNKLDDIIEEWCKHHQIKCFRGPEQDVLKRFKLAKDFINADTIIRLGADSPLIDPKIIDDVLEIYEQNNYDFVSNLFPVDGRTYPDGVNVEVFSSKLLDIADSNAKKPSEREHVTFYFWMQPENFKIFRHDYEKDLSKFRFNLDYLQDFCLIRLVFEELFPKNNYFTLNDVIDWLNKNPEVFKINSMIESNQGWNKSFEEDKKLNF